MSAIYKTMGKQLKDLFKDYKPNTPYPLPDNCTKSEDGTIWHWNDEDYKAQLTYVRE